MAESFPVLQGSFYMAQEQLWPDALSDLTNDFLLNSNPRPAGYKLSVLTTKPQLLPLPFSITEYLISQVGILFVCMATIAIVRSLLHSVHAL